MIKDKPFVRISTQNVARFSVSPLLRWQGVGVEEEDAVLVVVAGEDVAHAEVSVMFGAGLDLRLTDEGAARMSRLTGAVKRGHDRLAVVLNKRIRCAPIVQAPLSQTFFVSGLIGSEPEDVARALNTHR